jgi:hypothetical protein
MIAGLNKNDFESMMKGGKRSLADLLGSAKSQQLRSAVTSPTQNNNSPTDQGDAPTQELNEKGSPFVRIVNIRRIPRGKPVRCRLLAKENERKFIADQLNVVGIAVLAANVTLSLIEGDQTGVHVSGDVFVQLEDPFVAFAADSTSTSIDGDDSSLDQTGDDDFPLRFDDLDDDLFAIRTSFVSKLFFDPSAAILEKASRTSKQGKARERLLDFNHVDDFDDEIPPSGDIDIGDIVLQYLSMEISG